jgi:hypothetical protein
MRNKTNINILVEMLGEKVDVLKLRGAKNVPHLRISFSLLSKT